MSSASHASEAPKTSAPHAEGAAHSKTSLEALVQTLEFAWFATHAVVVVNTLLLLVFGRWPSFGGFLYRVLFVAAIGGFGIIAKQRYGNTVPQPRQLLSDDNVHYLFLALLWLITKQRFLAPIPFAIFSLFHVLTYARSYLLPALGYPTTSTYGRTIENFVKTRNDQFTAGAATVEFLILLEVVFQLLTFRKGSFIPFAGYLVFFRLRYAVSGYTRNVVKSAEVRVDSVLSNPQIPPVVKQYWLQFKGIVAQIPGPAQVASHAKTQ